VGPGKRTPSGPAAIDAAPTGRTDDRTRQIQNQPSFPLASPGPSTDDSTGAATVRFDYFAVSDRSFKELDNNAENGWSASMTWVQPVRDRTDLVLEGILVSSQRPDRMRFGLDRDQTSAQARVALRTGF